mgnify:CR=1 FL=1
MKFTPVPDLVLSGVSHTYRSTLKRPVVALTPTDLTIDSGAVVALVGPEGSGKSTLLDIVAGRLLPTEGQVLLGGEPVVGPGRREVVIRPSAGSDVRAQLEEALATDPDVLLLDEPFDGLDDAERELLHEDLHAIWRDSRKTVVIATADAAHAVPLATRVIVLSAGPGEVVTDVHVDFGERRQPRGALLADPELLRFTGGLRVA